MSEMDCPKCQGVMEEKKIEKTVPFKGIEVNIIEDAFACPICGFSAGTIESAAKIQRAIAEAYRQQTGLLTGEDIKRLRNEKEMTQSGLAELSGFGVASIKRWETGAIQSKSADRTLRYHLLEHCNENSMTGNRTFSIPRIKLVANAFKNTLGRAILISNDKMLFAAKYLWYADMVARRELGRSMTGATYANLTYGPQLNNYRDLLDEIRGADVSEAEDLTPNELSIIERIARTFPKDRMVYDAAHKEPAWLETKKGELISYIWADRLIAKLG